MFRIGIRRTRGFYISSNIRQQEQTSRSNVLRGFQSVHLYSSQVSRKKPYVTSKGFLLGTAFGATASAFLFYLGRPASAQLNTPRDYIVGSESLFASTKPLKSIPVPIYNVTNENISAARKDITEFLGEDGVNDDLGARIAHSSTEWSAAPRGDLDRPSLIVYPQSTEDVSRIVKICHRRRIPTIGFSGGTSLEGTLAATNEEICIDFSRMNKILALHPRDMDVVVQPGVGYEDLNKHLAAENLFFPPDPGPGAQIGGMISQGCSGTNAYRYGTVRDYVLGLTIVLADGSVIKTRHRPRKSSAGYNLTQLFVGSEGTLGYITEASCKVTVKQENIQVAVAGFPSTHDAINASVRIAQSGLPVAAMELLDGTTMGAVNQSGYTEKAYPEVATLFFKFAGSKTSVQEQITAVQKHAKGSRCISFEFSANEETAESLWRARKTALWSLMALKRNPDDKFLSADAAVPISRLADIIEQTNRRIRESDLVGSCLGHVGDGNFHTTIFYAEHEKAKARELITEVQKMAVDMEGTISGEHGIGLEYRDMLEYELGTKSVDAQRQIKSALDPLCLLNPNKMVRMKRQESEVEKGKG